MENKLIEAVKKHEVLYNTTLLAYKNKYNRASAWSSIAEELNLPETTCRRRWKILRDRYVRKEGESGSGAESGKTQWAYYHQMAFLRDFIKPRKTATSLTSPKPLKFEDESRSDASSCEPLEDHCSQSTDQLFDMGLTDSPAPVLNTNQKRPKQESIKVLNEPLNTISENHFAAPSLPARKKGKHEGFFSMVSEIFEDLPSDTVQDAKFYFINYLHEQMLANRNRY